MNNAYIACASTGKAAVTLGGTTVHSAFCLTTSRVTKLLSTENLQAYKKHVCRCQSCFHRRDQHDAILQQVNYRLQQITGIYDEPFGDIHVTLCGDFRQLPPIRATPCYTMPINQLGGPILWHSIDYFPLVCTLCCATNQRAVFNDGNKNRQWTSTKQR